MLRARLCMGILAVIVGVVWESGVMGGQSRDSCNCDCSCQPEIKITEGCCDERPKKPPPSPPVMTTPGMTTPGMSTPDIPTSTGTTTSTIPPTTTTNPCTDGYIPHEEDCYKFATCSGTCSWRDARTLCGGVSGLLMPLLSESEQSFLKSHTTGKVYVGATDAVSEGVWMWSNGYPLIVTNYDNWDGGATPANDANKDCMLVSEQPEGKWTHIDCDDNSVATSYACKYFGIV